MFTVFAILWYIVGFFGSLHLLYKRNEEITIADFVSCIFSGIAGPIGVLVVAAIYHGDKVIYQKKSR